MSLKAHEGYEQARRDDLESLGYILVYFLKGDLPWNLPMAEQLPIDIRDPHAFALITKQKQEQKKHDSEILKLKKSISIDDLCEDLDPVIWDYLNYVRQLEFTEKPDY